MFLSTIVFSEIQLVGWLLISKQDHSCIGNARLMGLQTDLSMSNQGYYNRVTMFCKFYLDGINYST